MDKAGLIKIKANKRSGKINPRMYLLNILQSTPVTADRIFQAHPRYSAEA